MSDSNVKSSQGWVVTFSGTAINLALGALYSWSVMKKPLGEKFGLTDTQTALPYSIAIIIFALSMVPAGRMQDKIGPRIVATLAGILVGAGFLVAGLAKPDGNALMFLIVGFGVLAGTGIGLGYAAGTPPAVKWFHPSKKGLIVGLVVGGFGLASVYVAPLTNYLIKAYNDPARAFTILGVFFLIIILIFSQFLKNPPEGYKPAAPDAAKKVSKSAPTSSGRDFSWKEMMATPQFYIIWIMYVFGSGAGLMVISFLAKHVVNLNPALKGFVFVAILAIGNASGRIIAGILSDRIGRVRTMLIVFLFQAVMLTLFPKFTGTPLLIVGSIFVGFCYGSCLSLFPSITADNYGLKNLGVNYGIVFTAWGVGGLIMPIIAGRVFDATGTYTTAFYVAAGICVAAAALSFTVRPTSHPAAPTVKEQQPAKA